MALKICVGVGGFMRVSVERVRTLSRFAAVALIGGLAAGCSSDTMRFSGSPFSNPFASKEQGGEPRMTGSVPAPRTAARSQPLPAPEPQTIVRSQPLPAPLPQTRAPAPTSAQPSVAKPTAVAAPAPRQAPVNAGPGGWTAYGGTPVTVEAGENLNFIANRYGVPASAILTSNGLTSAAQVAPGRRVIIPVYNAGSTQPASFEPLAPQGQGKLRFVEGAKPAAMKQGEAAKPHIRPGQTVANAELPPQRLVESAKAEPARIAKAEVQPPQAKAWAQPPQAAAPAPRSEPVQPAKEPEQSTGSLPNGSAADFRWPARGRVISGFGGGSGNEGINIALPEGTPVKAAEAGTVAYAGSEVKGYGNLVLIRHDNGFVSAYAHNEEITVKRGDKVKRGQVIAKSGQTGNVTSPQLHFEIRKGSTPVDPIPHLSGN